MPSQGANQLKHLRIHLLALSSDTNHSEATPHKLEADIIQTQTKSCGACEGRKWQQRFADCYEL